MMEPSVSVIVPVYNVEKYLRECVDSIIDQEHGNLEIILVDDGSTDYSPAICDEYAKTDHRIKVVHQENAGVAQARNRGLALATGKYIIFVDSDDMIFPDMIASMVSTVEGNSAIDIVIGNLTGKGNPDSAGTFEGVISQSRILNEVIIGKIQNLPVFENQNPYLNGFCTCLYKKEMIDQYGISFPGAAIGEDVLFHIRYLLQCRKAYFTGRSCYYYRFREESASNIYQPNLVEDYKLYYQTVKALLATAPVADSLVWKTLDIFGESAIRRELANIAGSGKAVREMRHDIKRVANQEMYTGSFTWKAIKSFPGGNKILHIILKMRGYIFVALYYKLRYQ